MIDKLKKLEERLGPIAENTTLDKIDILQFPDYFQALFNYKVFGENLLAIPGAILNKDDWQLPICFINDKNAWVHDEIDGKPLVPSSYIKMASLYNGDPSIFLHRASQTITYHYVADLFDKKWPEKGTSLSLTNFIEHIELQTICSLLNPKKYSLHDQFEIKNSNEVKFEFSCDLSYEKTWPCEVKIYETKNTIWYSGTHILDDHGAALEFYLGLIFESIKKGYEINFAPKFVLDKFEHLS